MTTERAIGAILAACIAMVLGLGAALLWRARSAPPPVPTPEPTATATITATPEPLPPASALRFRLAGTVVGDVTYAIIENIDGGNELVRPGQVVPGLGQILAVGERHITVEADGQQFELRLAAAPTPTQAPASPLAGPVTPALPPRDRLESESLP
ncbi:MAG: hypothetical protein AB7N53_06860 [Candidatus Binatia bacterium]